MTQPLRTFVDICAGVGGLSRPLHRAGATCVLAVEMDRFARMTYEANYGAVPWLHDVSAIHHPLDDVPDHDILLAGFPCQPFSSAGLQGGLMDPRGTIIYDIVRILGAKRPRAFLMENVRNLLHHDKGRTFKTILTLLTDLGYNVQWREVNAASFVPQHRRRIFIVGQGPDRPILDIQSLHVPTSHVQMGGVGLILHTNEGTPNPHDRGRFYDDMTRRVHEHYYLSAALYPWLWSHKNKQKARGGKESVNFIQANEMTATLTARDYKDGKEIILLDQVQQGFLIQSRPRKLTPRECFRLMGFDESFILPAKVSDTQLYKQAGNSVVPQCAAVFLNGLLAHYNP